MEPLDQEPQLVARIDSEDEGWTGPLPGSIEAVKRLSEQEPRSFSQMGAVFGGAYALLADDRLPTPIMQQYARDMIAWSYQVMLSLTPNDDAETRRVRMAPYVRDAAKLGITLT